ncbi:MAG TPA: UPF0280 family protein [Archaeoglobaceae archaeon]|nr:UPF0280 family protein [Archaeoglobaceae archaeon]
MYEERFYRKDSHSKFSLEVAFGESDLFISLDKGIEKEKAKEILKKYYTKIENYIKENPRFFSSLAPLEEDKDAPSIVKDMFACSRLTGIGPFSCVAGAIAFYVGKELLNFSSEVIVENGGDIFLKINEDKKIGVYLGEKFPKKYLTLKIKKRDYPFGIASSSSYLGHSLNFGRVDLLMVIAKNSIIADGFATALSNRTKEERDVEEILEFVKNNPSLEGILIFFEGKIFLWGDFEIEQ